jgi:hypothetical protein
MCNDQIRVISISISSNIYYFYVLGIFNPFYLFEIYNELMLIIDCATEH